MPRLSHADQRLVLDALKLLYSETDITRLPERLVRIAKQLVACDLGSYNEFDREDARVSVALRFPDSALIVRHFPAFLAYFREHPLTPHIRSTGGEPTKFSDFMTSRRLGRLNIYNEYFKEIGVRHQMLTVFDPNERKQRGVTLNRSGRDFSERDRAILHLLQPHLSQVYNTVASLSRLRAAGAAMEAAHTAQSQAILLVDREERVEWLSAQARIWLRDFLDADLDVGALLPGTLARWLAAQRAGRARADQALAAPPAAVRFSKPQGFLNVRYAAEDAEGHASLLLTFESAMATSTVNLPCLTARENEVLGWIAQGKGNPEIAVILGLKVRTVYKHVENIFAKLDVESRAAAMLVAINATKNGSR